MILLAAVVKDATQIQGVSFSERLNTIKANQDEVLQKLQEIRDNETLKICFLPGEPALEFSIHNATSTSTAKAYFKRDSNFIQWLEGPNACKLWGDLKKWCGKELPPGIFHSTILCDIRNFKPLTTQAAFIDSLNRELKRHFPDILERVKELWYSNEAPAGPGT
jgi:hypothetical protein